MKQDNYRFGEHAIISYLDYMSKGALVGGGGAGTVGVLIHNGLLCNERDSPEIGSYFIAAGLTLVLAGYILDMVRIKKIVKRAREGRLDDRLV